MKIDFLGMNSFAPLSSVPHNGAVKPKHKLSFNHISATKFEEFCYDLLDELGFIHLDWRKGTGKKTSPSDSGRDIVGYFQRTDVDRTKRSEKWFIDCKHYRKGVPAKDLHNLLAWSDAERPNIALFMVSNFLSNSAKDYLESYKRNNHPPFEIRYWERTNLEQLTRGKRDLLQIHGLLKSALRPESEIVDAEQEFFDRVWYQRHLFFKHTFKIDRRKKDPQLVRVANEAAKRVRKRYGSGIGKPLTDFDWGMINGKLSAIRWVLGEEWDFLDT